MKPVFRVLTRHLLVDQLRDREAVEASHRLITEPLNVEPLHLVSAAQAASARPLTFRIIDSIPFRRMK